MMFPQPREDAHRQEEAGAASDPAGAGTTQWTCGWCCRVWPQVWRTMVVPIWAPRCLESAAMMASVSAAARNRIARVTDRFGGDPGVACRACEAGMAKQYLDDAHVRPALQEMGRECVPQGVHRHRLAQASRRAG